MGYNSSELEGRLRSLLQFIGVWGAWIAFTVGTISIALWPLSFDDDPSDERAASFLLWSMFWPLVWLYRWLTGKNHATVPSRSVRSTAFRTTSQTDRREQSIQRFRTIREAKEYLASVIAEEAERDGTPLTEVERKMLYFTETGWTLPDMKEISAKFDRDYDQDKYEQKIASIISRIQTHLTDGQERTRWGRAFEKLSEGDHYLLVLADAATPTQKGARHNLKMVIIALVFFALGALGIWFRHWLRDH
jgi:hypothetical protein